MVKQRHLEWLLVVLCVVVLLPGAIAIATVILDAANESAGYLRHRLPEVFFWTFLFSGGASPFIGIGALIVLWTQRRKEVVSSLDRRLKTGLIITSLAALLAPAVWIFLVTDVFFVAGGNR